MTVHINFQLKAWIGSIEYWMKIMNWEVVFLKIEVISFKILTLFFSTLNRYVLSWSIPGLCTCEVGSNGQCGKNTRFYGGGGRFTLITRRHDRLTSSSLSAYSWRYEVVENENHVNELRGVAVVGDQSDARLAMEAQYIIMDLLRSLWRRYLLEYILISKANVWFKSSYKIVHLLSYGLTSR